LEKLICKCHYFVALFLCVVINLWWQRWWPFSSTSLCLLSPPSVRSVKVPSSTATHPPTLSRDCLSLCSHRSCDPCFLSTLQRWFAVAFFQIFSPGFIPSRFPCTRASICHLRLFEKLNATVVCPPWNGREVGLFFGGGWYGLNF